MDFRNSSDRREKNVDSKSGGAKTIVFSPTSGKSTVCDATRPLAICPKLNLSIVRTVATSVTVPNSAKIITGWTIRSFVRRFKSAGRFCADFVRFPCFDIDFRCYQCISITSVRGL